MRTEIYVNNQRLELFEDIPMSLNFAIADIREPEKRNTSYSKTITIPGSKVNNRIFSHAYEISGLVYGLDFNPSVKAAVRVLVDSIQVFEGSLQLLKVTNNQGRIEYECAMFGRLANVFYNWGEARVSELDFSEYDHTYSIADIENSWDANVRINGTATPRTLGTDNEGYVYPMIDYTGKAASNTWVVNDMRPAVYLKTVLDKMFAFAGFTYECDLFEEGWFRQLIIPFNREKLQLPVSYIQKLLFRAGMTTDMAVSMSGMVGEAELLFDDESIPNFDNGNTFNALGFTPFTMGTYNFKVNLEVALETDSADTTAELAVSVELYKYNNNTTVETSLHEEFYPLAISPPDSAWKTIAFTESAVPLLPEETVYLRVKFTHDIPDDADPILNVRAATALFENSVNAAEEITEGEILPMAAALPEIKIKDLFLALVKTFNLYVQPDKDNERKLLISPRNEFYNDGVIVDWSRKVDFGQAVEIEPMGALDARRYFYTFSEDKDYDNDKYTKTYKQTYGEFTYEVANDFLTETNETKVMWGPTPMVGFLTHTRVLPRIIKRDDTTDKPTGSLPRLLYYGGLITGTAWTLNAGSKSTYPYAGHLDHPATPALDLNFGTPQEVYFVIDPADYTTNNLFNAYHKQFIEEITDIDSKLVMCYVFLTPMDIESLSFKNAFFLLGDNFRLNRISDYDPNSNQPAQVELIKIKQRSAFVASTGATITVTAQ